MRVKSSTQMRSQRYSFEIQDTIINRQQHCVNANLEIQIIIFRYYQDWDGGDCCNGDVTDTLHACFDPSSPHR